MGWGGRRREKNKTKTPKKVISRHRWFTGEAYQMFKDKLAAGLQNLFQKIQEEGILLNSSHEANISDTKPRQRWYKKNFKVISLMNTDEKYA